MGNCLLCNMPEPDGIQPDGSKRVYKPTGDFVCSICTQLLVMATPQQIQSAYNKAVEMDAKKKIDFLERYLEDSGDAGTENNSRVVKRSMDRKRAGRETRSFHHKQGA